MTDEQNQIQKQPSVAMTANGFMPTTMEEAWRFATALSKSRIIPEEYRGHPEDCMVALDISSRLKTPYLMLMQHLYVIKGKPSLDSQMTTSLVNMSNYFVDPLEYEVEGENVRDKDYRVRAYAVRKATDKVLYGPWITWELVKSEGWFDKAGSKWKSMPEQMFHYRAASWFQRRYCPEITMGMMTSEELRDMPETIKVKSTTIEDEPKTNIEKLRDKLTTAKQEGEKAGEEKLTEKDNQKEAQPEKQQEDKPKTKKSKKDKEEEKKLREAEARAKAKYGTKEEMEAAKKYKCINEHEFDEPKMDNLKQEYVCPECGTENYEEI